MVQHLSLGGAFLDKAQLWMQALRRRTIDYWYATTEGTSAAHIEATAASVVVSVLNDVVFEKAHGTRYVKLRDAHPRGRVVLGLQLIRNAEIHSLEVVPPDERALFSIPDLGFRQQLTWPKLDALPEAYQRRVTGENRARGPARDAYRKWVGGRPIAETLLEAVAFFEALEPRLLKAEFHKHRDAERDRRKQVEARETTDRLKRLAREASKFMREKLEEAGALGSGEVVRTKSFAEKGVGISPAFTQIEVGASRTFTVRVSRELGLPAGTVVKVALSKSAGRALEVVGQPVDLEPDPLHEDLLRGSFTLRGTAETGTVQVGCQVGSLDLVYADVQVVEPGPTEVEIADGFAFQRKNYTVRPAARKKLVVRARFDRPVAEPPSVTYTVADSTVIALRQRTALELVEGTTFYEGSVVVEGKRPIARRASQRISTAARRTLASPSLHARTRASS